MVQQDEYGLSPTSRQFVTSLIAGVNHIHGSNTRTDQNPLDDSSASLKSHLLSLHVLFPNEFLAALDLLDRGLITRLVIKSNDQTSDNHDPRRIRASLRANAHVPQLLRPVHRSALLPEERTPAQAGSQAQEDEGTPPRCREQMQARHQEEMPVREEAMSMSSSSLMDDRPEKPFPSAAEQTTSSSADENKPLGFYYVRSAQQSRHQFSSHHHSSSNSISNYEVRLHAWSCSCPAFTFAAFPAQGNGRDLDDQDNDLPTSLHSPQIPSSSSWIFGGLTKGSDLAVCKHLLACVLAEYTRLFGEMVETRPVTVEELAGWAGGWGDGW